MLPLGGEVGRVAGAILERIVSGAYPAGLRLPAEVELAEAYNCGRSTVREALRHLSDVGLIRSKRGSGALVLDYRREGTPALLPMYIAAARFDQAPSVVAREMLELRTMLAVQAVRVAARYASPAKLQAARDVLDRAAELESDPLAHANAELDFYRELLAASEVWPAVWLANAFWSPMRQIHGVVAPFAQAVRPDFQDAMRTLLAAIEAGQEEEAVSLSSQYFEEGDRSLVEIIAGLLDSTSPGARGAESRPTEPRAVNHRKEAQRS